MSVFENFRKEDLEYWKDEYEIEVVFGVECTFEEFMEFIWAECPSNPESENYEDVNFI